MVTLIPVVYLSGAVLAVWPTVQAVNHDVYEPEWEDWWIAGVAAVIVAALWPAVLCAVIAYRVSRWLWRGLLRDRPGTSDRDPEGSRHA